MASTYGIPFLRGHPSDGSSPVRRRTISEDMRPLILTLALLLLAGPNLGCFVLDELDAGEKEMARYRPNTQEEPANPKAGEDGGEKPPSYQDQLNQWWGEARSLDAQDIDDSIVRCRLAGATQFMSRDDCAARGGQASEASG